MLLLCVSDCATAMPANNLRLFFLFFYFFFFARFSCLRCQSSLKFSNSPPARSVECPALAILPSPRDDGPSPGLAGEKANFCCRSAYLFIYLLLLLISPLFTIFIFPHNCKWVCLFSFSHLHQRLLTLGWLLCDAALQLRLCCFLSSSLVCSATLEDHGTLPYRSVLSPIVGLNCITFSLHSMVSCSFSAKFKFVSEF